MVTVMSVQPGKESKRTSLRKASYEYVSVYPLESFEEHKITTPEHRRGVLTHKNTLSRDPSADLFREELVEPFHGSHHPRLVILVIHNIVPCWLRHDSQQAS